MIPLVDTHQHLILPDRLGYGWTGNVPVLAGQSFDLAAYHALTAGAGIGGTIVMEADIDGDHRREARLVAGLMAEPGSNVLGQIAACRPETTDGFDAWVAEGATLGVVGYRRILHEVADDVSRSETFRANIRRLGTQGMTFDMVFHARQLPVALELARACPDTPLVLDHCGVPDIAAGAMDPWRADILALAGCANVTAKISGVFAYAGGPASLASVRPWVDHVIAAFGPDRCLWGSDWPVVNRGGDLPGWIAATRAILGALTPDEAAAIAHGTAERTYRVRLPQ